MMLTMLRKLRRLSDPGFRRGVLRQLHTSWLLAALKPPGALQPFNDTAMDRYPEVFRAASQLLSTSGGTLRLLSWGCSTGEEVLTLRRYFPTAHIVGVDINPWNVVIARWRCRRDPRARIVRTGRVEGVPAGEFEVVFCMAVLRNGRIGQDAVTCRPFLRFTDVDQMVSTLAARLPSGGLLAVEHCQFRLSDLGVYADFHVIHVPGRHSAPQAMHFGKDDRRLPAGVDQEVLLRRR